MNYFAIKTNTRSIEIKDSFGNNMWTSVDSGTSPFPTTSIEMEIGKEYPIKDIIYKVYKDNVNNPKWHGDCDMRIKHLPGNVCNTYHLILEEIC